MVKAIKHNECLPSIEKIDLEEFVIDHEERDRLLAAADTSVLEVRQEIETENLKKIVIKDRIKVILVLIFTLDYISTETML